MPLAGQERIKLDFKSDNEASELINGFSDFGSQFNSENSYKKISTKMTLHKRDIKKSTKAGRFTTLMRTSTPKKLKITH